MTPHTCIKPGCGKTYSDADPDAYYCPDCLKQKKIIAAEIDKKLLGKPRTQILTPLQEYDLATVNVKGMKFMHVKL